MKKINRIIVLVALLATSLSSCNKDDDVDVRVAVGVGNGGIFIDIYAGGYVNNRYYYPNNWGNPNEVKFLGYVEQVPYSMVDVPITDGKGNVLIGPDGGPVLANVQTSMMKLSNWDYAKYGPQRVSIEGSISNGSWFYVIH